jgi:hypothetical protein
MSSRVVGIFVCVDQRDACQLAHNKTSCRRSDFPHALKVLDTRFMAFAYSYFLIADIKIMDTNRMMLQRNFAGLPDRTMCLADNLETQPANLLKKDILRTRHKLDGW